MAKLRLTSDADLVRIEVTDGDWVEVKRALGRDDERRVVQLLLNGAKLDMTLEVRTQLGDMQDGIVFATLEVALKRWSLRDPETNRVADINRRTIRALDDADLAIIREKLDELYPGPRSDDERKNSSGGGAPPSETREASPQNSAGLP